MTLYLAGAGATFVLLLLLNEAQLYGNYLLYPEDKFKLRVKALFNAIPLAVVWPISCTAIAIHVFISALKFFLY